MKFNTQRFYLSAIMLTTGFNAIAMEGKREREHNEEARDESGEKKAKPDEGKEVLAEPLQATITPPPPAMPMPTTAHPEARLNAILKQLWGELGGLFKGGIYPSKSLEILYSISSKAKTAELHAKQRQEKRRQAEQAAQKAAKTTSERTEFLKKWETDQSTDMVVLQSNTGAEFRILVRQAKLSETIKNLIEDAGIQYPLPFPNIDTPTLQIIATLLPELEKSSVESLRNPLFFIPRQLQKVINQRIKGETTQQLIRLLEAANYLDISFLSNGFASANVDRIPATLRDSVLKARGPAKTKNEKKQQSDAKTELKESGLQDLVDIRNDPWKYIAKYIAHRQCGATEEWSVADHILYFGKNTSKNLQISRASNHPGPITSLFGIDQLEGKESVVDLHLERQCFFSFSRELNPQRTEHPFAGFSSLRDLHLERSDIVSLEPQMFSACPSLQTLNLSENKLTLLPGNAFSGLLNLITLNLNSNELRAVTKGAFNGLESLDRLILSKNRLTSDNLDHESFNLLTKLQELDLSRNNLPEFNETGIKGLTLLRSLHLEHNRIKSLSDITLASLVGIESLSFLDLTSNKFSLEERLRTRSKLPERITLHKWNMKTLEGQRTREALKPQEEDPRADNEDEDEDDDE